jgi:hypothetical protein
MKVQFHYPNPLSVDIETDTQVDVFIDIYPTNTKGLKILFLEEPEWGELYEYALNNQGAYHWLMTFRDEMLHLPKALKFHCRNSWVKGYIPTKRFSISTVVGGKSNPKMEGYALRHDLWRNRDKITVPKEFYLSGNAAYSHHFVMWPEVDYTDQLVLGASKTPLFDAMFHIAIENTSINNYFTEKIVDCFQTRTVPIYYGCKNINDYFNPMGILQAHNLDEIIDFANAVTPEFYNSMMKAIEENFLYSEEHTSHPEQIRNAIIKILKHEGIRVFN